MAAATTDFARVGASIDPQQGLEAGKLNQMAEVGIQIHSSMAPRLRKYYEKKKTLVISNEVATAAKQSKEGDHEDDLLGTYSRFFKEFIPENNPSIVDDTKDMFVWLEGLNRLDLLWLFKDFRTKTAGLKDIPPLLERFHKIFCDAFELYFASSARGAGTDFDKGLDCLEVMHFAAKTSNATMKGHPPPPRPLQLIIMLLGNLVTVTPLWTLLVDLQRCKDNRQHCPAKEGASTFPDQTILSDFFVWAHAFFTFLNGKWLIAKKDRLQPLGIKPEPNTDPVFGNELEALLRKSVVPLNAPRRKVGGTFVVYQQPLWLTVPSSKSGLKFKPWAVDLVIPSEPESKPIRLGKIPYFTSKPGWQGQLVALFEHFDKHKYMGSGALLDSISFSNAGDTLDAHDKVSAPPLGMGCNTNEEMHALLFTEMIMENAFTLSKKALQVMKLDKTDHTEIYWQLHAEPLSMKGSMTVEYLRSWYEKAAAFYKLKPWTKCSQQNVIEVFANGIGRRNVVICGSDGMQIALRLFKVGKPADLATDHDACIFTSQSNCAFSDIRMIEDFRLEIADEFGYPSLFSGCTTFKRPPFAELEMYRVCFDVLSEYFAKNSIDRDAMGNADKHFQSSHDANVMGEAHPRRVELIFPASLYRDEPELISADNVDVDLLKSEATSEVISAYNAALDSFKTHGGSSSESTTAAQKAVDVNIKVAAYMIGHKKTPPYSSLLKPKPESKAGILARQAFAYCILALDDWRAVPGSLQWIEQNVHKLHPLPHRVVKCGYGVCNNAGIPKDFKRCSACKAVLYCCAGCQRKDWPNHKLVCKKLAAETASS